MWQHHKQRGIIGGLIVLALVLLAGARAPGAAPYPGPRPPRPVMPTKDVLVALSPAAPKAGSGALVSILGCILSAPVAADCCTASDCTCDGSDTDEAGCPSCVQGSVLNYLTTGTGTNYLSSQQDRDTFNTLWSNGNWARLKQFLDSQGVPSPVGDMLMGQIAVAQKFEQYKNDALSGTSQSRPSKRSTPAWSPCSMSGHAASGLPPKPEPSAGVESLTLPRPPDSLGSPSKPV